MGKDTLSEEVIRLIGEATGAGFWISPDGRAFEVEQNHIISVITAPERYGLTKKRIRDIYKKHGEKVGTEGDAREEIILGLVAKGWIRARNYSRYGDTSWTLNVMRLSNRMKDHITDFFQKLSKSGGYLGSIVRIDTPRGTTVLSPQEIASYGLYNEALETSPSNRVSFISESAFKRGS